MLSIRQRELNLRAYYYYYKGNIDGIEGNGLKSAYKNFQRDNNLVVDGIYGSNTENKLLLCIKNTQSILNKYGYNLVVDGIVGDATINAIKDFQGKHGLAVDGIAGKQTFVLLENGGKTQKYTCKYFKDSEFTCKCGCGLNIQKDGIKRIADDIREHFGKPAIITSGTRCVKHNRVVGGVDNSFHTKGNAIDIYINGVSGEDLLFYCKTLVSKGLARYTYLITGNAVHIDTGNLE